MATGRSGNFKFSNPTIWLNSYTYIEWTSTLNADRSHTVNVKQYMYVQANNSLSGTWTFSSTILNSTQYDTTLINITRDGIPHTVLLGEYSFTVAATNDRSPSVEIFTYATINIDGGNGPGTSNASAVAVLDAIPLPVVTTPTVTKIENSVLSTASSLNVISALTNSAYSYYKLRLKYSKYSTMSSATAIDYAFGVSSINSDINGLDPYTTYYIAIDAVGLDGNTYVTSTIVPVTTYDLLPLLTTYTIIATTQTDITVQYQVVSKSPVEYIHYLDGVSYGASVYSDNSVVQYTYSGLSPAVTYQFGIILANDGGIITINTISASTADAPPTISNVNIVAASTSINVTVNAVSSAGVRGYQFSKDNGNTWTAEQTSNTYVFSGLRINTPYNIKVIVYDDLGLSTTSSTYSTTTLFTPPVITGITATNITNMSASVKITATSGAGISNYFFIVYPSTYAFKGILGSATLLPPVYPGSIGDFYLVLDTGYSWAWDGADWIDITLLTRPSGYITSSVFTAIGLTANTSYDAMAYAIDNQGTIATLATEYQFDTLLYNLTDTVSIVKFTKNLSTELANIPKVDGNLIVTLDDGNIYLDYKTSVLGAVERTILGTSKTIHTAVVDGTDTEMYNITASTLPTVYEAPYILLNYTNGMELYLMFSDSNATPGTRTLNVNSWGAKEVHLLDGTALTDTVASRIYHVIYSATLGYFVELTS